MKGQFFERDGDYKQRAQTPQPTLPKHRRLTSVASGLRIIGTGLLRPDSPAYGKGEDMLRAIVENTLRRVDAFFRHRRLGKKLVVGLTLGALVLTDQGAAYAFNPVRAYYRLMRQQMRWERGTPFLDFLGQQLQNDNLLSLLQGLIDRQDNDDSTTAQGALTTPNPAREDQGLKSSYDRLVKSYESRYGTFTPSNPTPAPPWQPSTRRRGSLHVGINNLGPGWGPQQALKGCVRDANDMAQLAREAGFSETPIILTEANATVSNVLAQLDAASQKFVNPGELFLVTLSSHGTRQPDQNNEEEDRTDEMWCLYDDGLLDDDVFTALAKFKPGVNVVVLLDTCHSGTAIKVVEQRMKSVVARTRSSSGNVSDLSIRFLNEAAAAQAVTNGKFNVATRAKVAAPQNGYRESVTANVLLISACQDSEKAWDDSNNGVFTAALKRVWNRGAFRGDYGTFHTAIVDELRGAQQRPNLYSLGPNTAALEDQAPFSAP